jgi:hypothetical protein
MHRVPNATQVVWQLFAVVTAVFLIFVFACMGVMWWLTSVPAA